MTQEERDRLVEANTPLVYHLSQKYRSPRVPTEDLIQEGILGLIEAIDHYEPTKGTQFSTCAAYWISGRMYRAIHQYANVIALPMRAYRVVEPFERFCQCYLEENGHLPSIKEVAVHLKVSRFIARALLEERNQVLSLEAPLPTAPHCSVGDDLATEEEDGPESLLLALCQREELIDLVSRLEDERERLVILYRYGLCDGEYHTFREVGELIGLNKERARNIERAALENLRKLAHDN